MDHEKIIRDVISPLIEHKDNVSIVMLEQENLRDHTYVVYCDEQDIGRLIGKGGTVANAIREIMNIYAKLENKRIRLKFDVKK